MQKVNKSKCAAKDTDDCLSECTVGGRYRLLYRKGGSPHGISDARRAKATDIYTGKRVELHIYSAEDGGMLMREADITSALEGVGEGSGKYASVPVPIDAHLADGDAEPFGYLVYPDGCDTVTLGDYLARPDIDPDMAYYALRATANTLTYAAELGIFHGLFCERTVQINERTGKYTLAGLGLYDDISFDDDAERARALLARIDKSVPMRARARRHSEARQSAAEAVQALGRVKRRAKTVPTPIHAEPPKSRRAPKRSPTLAGAMAALCMICLALMLSGAILVDAKLFGTEKSLEVDIPPLVGLVYGGYDAEGNVYVLTDRDGNRTELDAEIFKLNVSGSDEYAEPPSFAALEMTFGAGTANGTVICQEPAASRTGKAIPGKSRAEIGITVLRDKNLNGSEVELESLGIYGLDIDRAESLLARYNITVDRVVRYNRSIPRGRVYSAPDSGKSARVGDTVRLYVSGGEAE